MTGLPWDQEALLAERALPQHLEAVGERSSFLILRGAFNGGASDRRWDAEQSIAGRPQKRAAHGAFDRSRGRRAATFSARWSGWTVVE
jgi:hypothetical protein